MKKAVFLSVLIICVLLASCSGNKSEKLGTFSNKDMVLVLDGKSFRFGEDAKPLIDFLGEPNDVTENLSCYYEGYDKVYKYEKINIATYPKDCKDILNVATFNDGTYKFKGGVTAGSKKGDVIKSYGDKFFMENDAMIYNETNDKNDNDSPRLSFILKDDIVRSIEFSRSYFS